MKQRGVVLETHRATKGSTKLVGAGDLVLTITASQKATILRHYGGAPKNVFTLAEYTGTKGDVVDPLPIGTPKPMRPAPCS